MHRVVGILLNYSHLTFREMLVFRKDMNIGFSVMDHLKTDLIKVLPQTALNLSLIFGIHHYLYSYLLNLLQITQSIDYYSVTHLILDIVEESIVISLKVIYLDFHLFCLMILITS